MQYLRILGLSLYLGLSLVIVAACSTSVQQAPSPQATADSVPTRLSDVATPTSYHLELMVQPEREIFHGTTTIDVRLSQATSTIWLHGKDLDVGEASVLLADGTEIPATYSQRSDSGMAALDLDQEIQAQDVKLKIVYRAHYNGQLEGLYRTQQAEDWYAFTQMEPISARLAFPCFDEPVFKTPFDVTVTTSASNTVIGNGPEIETVAGNGDMKTVRFATTAPLPTYLVALAVGPLDVVEVAPIPANEVRSKPLAFRGVAARGKGKELAYAMKHTGAILEILERYMDSAYPFAKLDIIAVPDFAAGAMENVGAITFRDWLLQIDETTATANQFRAFAGVMAHELVHQWFGNLVTMPWWDDLWLNESFATWLTNPVIEEWEPSYKSSLSAVSRLTGTMSSDSKVTSRMVRQPIDSDHDIHNAFDGITYGKGGSVLNMFESYVGREAFRKTIKHYLKKHAFSTATGTDFLNALKETISAPVAESFATFLTQPGVPMLNVTPSCNDTKTTLAIKQSRYLPLGSEGDPQAFTWKVPMCVRFGMGNKTHRECFMVTEKSQSVTFETPGCATWIHPNARGAGYYRWTLPSQWWTHLDTHMNKLDNRERMTLADSLEASAQAGQRPVADLLNMTQAIARSTERYVATAPMSWLGFMHKHLVTEENRQKLETFAQQAYQPHRQLVAMMQDNNTKITDDTKLFRQSLVDFFANVARDPALRTKLTALGKARFEEIQSPNADATSLDPNLVNTALAVAVQESDIAFLKSVIEVFGKTTGPMVRRQLLSAIASANQPEQAALIRELVLGDTLRDNERLTLLARHMRIRENLDADWAWLQQNFDALVKKVPTFHAGRLPHLASGFCTAKQSNSVDAFFKQRIKDLPGGPRNLAKAIESIKLCASVATEQRKSANAYFDGKK